MNIFETKAKREVWLDKFAVSNMPIDLFCKMNHIKKETITKALDEKMSKYRAEHPSKEPAVKANDFVEIKTAAEPIIEKVQIIDDEVCYEKPAEKIIVKVGKATIEVPLAVEKIQLQTILKAVAEL